MTATKMKKQISAIYKNSDNIIAITSENKQSLVLVVIPNFFMVIKYILSIAHYPIII